jgi:hypothetical protein
MILSQHRIEYFPTMFQILQKKHSKNDSKDRSQEIL